MSRGSSRQGARSIGTSNQSESIYFGRSRPSSAVSPTQRFHIIDRALSENSDDSDSSASKEIAEMVLPRLGSATLSGYKTYFNPSRQLSLLIHSAQSSPLNIHSYSHVAAGRNTAVHSPDLAHRRDSVEDIYKHFLLGKTQLHSKESIYTDVRCPNDMSSYLKQEFTEEAFLLPDEELVEYSRPDRGSNTEKKYSKKVLSERKEIALLTKLDNYHQLSTDEKQYLATTVMNDGINQKKAIKNALNARVGLSTSVSSTSTPKSSKFYGNQLKLIQKQNEIEAKLELDLVKHVVATKAKAKFRPTRSRVDRINNPSAPLNTTGAAFDGTSRSNLIRDSRNPILNQLTQTAGAGPVHQLLDSSHDIDDTEDSPDYEESTIDHPKLGSVEEKMEDLRHFELENWCRRRGMKFGNKLTVKQKMMLRKWFREIDADGSGEVSAEELMDALLSSGVFKTREQVIRISSNIDKNGSKGIDFQEFLTALSSNKLADRSKLAKLQDMSANELGFTMDTLLTEERRLKFLQSIFYYAIERNDNYVHSVVKLDRAKADVKEHSKAAQELKKLEDGNSRSTRLHHQYINALESIVMNKQQRSSGYDQSSRGAGLRGVNFSVERFKFYHNEPVSREASSTNRDEKSNPYTINTSYTVSDDLKVLQDDLKLNQVSNDLTLNILKPKTHTNSYEVYSLPFTDINRILETEEVVGDNLSTLQSPAFESKTVTTKQQPHSRSPVITRVVQPYEDSSSNSTAAETHTVELGRLPLSTTNSRRSNTLNRMSSTVLPSHRTHAPESTFTYYSRPKRNPIGSSLNDLSSLKSSLQLPIVTASSSGANPVSSRSSKLKSSSDSLTSASPSPSTGNLYRETSNTMNFADSLKDEMLRHHGNRRSPGRRS